MSTHVLNTFIGKAPLWTNAPLLDSTPLPVSMLMPGAKPEKADSRWSVNPPRLYPAWVPSANEPWSGPGPDWDDKKEPEPVLERIGAKNHFMLH